MIIALGIIAILIGYLLGSVLPAYFIGRLKGIDIRKEGDKNPGATNIYRVLGPWPAAVTAFYDVLKGVAAMGLAYLLNLPPLFIHLSGVAAIIGHVFPFYLKLKGGQGTATSVGLLLVYLAILLRNGWLPWQDLALLGLLVVALWVIFRRGAAVGVLVLPLLVVFVLLNSPSLLLNIFFAVVTLYIVSVNLSHIYLYKIFQLKPQTKEALKHLRVLLRPAAIAFPLLYLFFPRKSILALLGSVALFFILVDLLRLGSKTINVFAFKWLAVFFREKERHTFSTATLFLASSFLTILLFDKAIATAALVFLIFGDIFAKFTGLEHGRWRIFGKTLDGTLAYFASCLIAGFLWSRLVPLPFSLLAVGALAAALAELFPLGVNDNFVIPLVSAATMRAIQIFF